MSKYFDIGTISVIIITFLLFALALFTKGFTHDLLLEAGILLISVKLIMMAYKTTYYFNAIINELKKLNESITRNP